MKKIQTNKTNDIDGPHRSHLTCKFLLLQCCGHGQILLLDYLRCFYAQIFLLFDLASSLSRYLVDASAYKFVSNNATTLRLTQPTDSHRTQKIWIFFVDIVKRRADERTDGLTVQECCKNYLRSMIDLSLILLAPMELRYVLILTSFRF